MTVREYLTGKEDLIIKKAVIQAVEPRLVGRRALPVWDVGAAAQEVGYDKEVAEMPMAEIIAKAGSFPRNIISEARVTKPVVKIGQGFDIPREDILTSRRLGTPLNTRMATAAGRSIARKEDNLLFNGDSDWGIQGMLDAAGNTVAATAMWSDATNADPYKDINAALTALEENGYEGRILFIHPTNFGEARGMYIPNTATTYLEQLQELVPTILKSDTIPEGTALLCDVGEDIAQLAVAENLSFENRYDSDRQVYAYNAWERIIPLIYRPEAFCKITGI